MCRSYGVTLWYPTYVNEVNHQKDVEIFNGFCSEEVSGINSSTISTYCGCNDSVINNSVISDMLLDNWNIQNTTFNGVTFQRVNFTYASFNNTSFESSSFIDCTFNNSGFINTTFDSFSFTNLKLFDSRLCSTTIGNNYSASGDVLVLNSTINGAPWNSTMTSATFIQLMFNSSANESACNANGWISKCPVKGDDFRLYRDSFFISASALPGNLASMVAVYFLIRKYWLGKKNILL